MSLVLSGIRHDYGDGLVLRGVDLTVARGEVHALLGMNGAGKSTLVHIATGELRPTGGTLTIDDRPVSTSDPLAARRAGVILLAQEVDRALVADATVHENLTAGLLRRERSRAFSPRRNRERARAILARYGIDLDVDRPVFTLSLYEKQVLALARAAASDASYLLLDEPTSSFDAAETRRFYRIVRALQADGLGMVFISHRLDEVFEISDHLTVLRGGEVALAASTAETDVNTVVDTITGGSARLLRHARSTGDRPAEAGPAGSAPTRAPVFTASEVQLGRGRPPVDLSVRAGEIVVVFGQLGTGKSTLARSIFGLSEPYRATVGREEITVHHPGDARRAGVALVPEERRHQALWLDEDVRTHLALGFSGIIHSRREAAHATGVSEAYDVQPRDIRQIVRRLSGGNQQKVAIAKWAGVADRRLLVLDEPMKGVDVGAKEAIFTAITQTAAAGVGVLYLTAEPDDALRIADRIMVFGRAGVVLDQPAATLTALDLMTDPTPAAHPDHSEPKAAVS